MGGNDQTSEIARPRDPSSVTADQTTPIPVPGHRLETPQVALLFVAIAAGALLIGIAVAQITRPGTDETVLAEADVDRAGRTVRFEGGHLLFPPGAVTERIRVVVTSSLVEDRLRVLQEDDPIVVEPGRLVAYRFAPTDVTFAEPVEIVLRLEEGTRNGVLFTRSGDEVVLVQGTIDPARATATVRVRDFRFAGGAAEGHG